MATQAEQKKLTDFASTASETAGLLEAERQFNATPGTRVSDAMLMRVDRTARRLTQCPQYFALFNECRDLVMDNSALVDEIAELRRVLKESQDRCNGMMLILLEQTIGTEKVTLKPSLPELRAHSLIGLPAELGGENKVHFHIGFENEEAKLARANAPEHQELARAVRAADRELAKIPPMFGLGGALHQRFENVSRG